MSSATDNPVYVVCDRNKFLIYNIAPYSLCSSEPDVTLSVLIITRFIYCISLRYTGSWQ